MRLMWLGLILVLLSGYLGCSLWVGRQRATALDVDLSRAADLSARGFSHVAFEQLLTRFVSAAGRVDYAAWYDDPDALAALDRYLAAVKAYSPDNAPQRFAQRGDQLAYWVYAYNAWVIKAILVHWPLQSVNDVKAPLELVKGMGFFHTQTVVVGGERMNLLDLEKKSIGAAFHEPRVHFVLNCGSEGCPIQPTILPVGAQMEPFLAQAACRFVANPKNVRIDVPRQRVMLSEIFDWYQDEFVEHSPMVQGSRNRRLLAYVASVAPADLGGRLAAAGDFTVQFNDYDWAVNKARLGDPRPIPPDKAPCP